MGARRTMTVTLETVTPLFLGGADPRGEPELRAPSFRGALRYWLRAALGGALGDDPVVVRKAETAVFGSADPDLGGASPITVRVHRRDLPNAQAYVKDKALPVEKEGRTVYQPTGRDYLYWSMAESGKRERSNYQAPKQFYPPETRFHLSLTARPGADRADQAFDLALAALWLLLNLGGVGSRSRRTGGSLSLLGKHEAGGLTLHLEAKDPAQAANQLAAGLRTIRRSFGTTGHGPVRRPPHFDVISPDVCRVWVLGAWSKWNQAVEALGAAMRDFRTYREPDHSAVARWLNGHRIATVERAVFGLPLPYRYSSGLAAVIQGRLEGPALDRRASPLWLKVSRSVEGVYFGVATLFESAFLPSGEQLHAKTSGYAPPTAPPADYSLIVKWIEQKFPERREVHYE